MSVSLLVCYFFTEIRQIWGYLLILIRYLSDFFGDIPEGFVHWLETFTNFLFVCQSVSWLTSLLKLYKYRDISCSWWVTFLKYFGDIPEMFVHYFKIIGNFLYVCQSISWLTYLLILGQYRDISCSGWDIFPKFLGTFLGCFDTIARNANCLYVCQSVCWLISL